MWLQVYTIGGIPWILKKVLSVKIVLLIIIKKAYAVRSLRYTNTALRKVYCPIVLLVIKKVQCPIQIVLLIMKLHSVRSLC